MTSTSPYLALRQTALQYPDNDFLHIPASARKHYATPEPLTLRYGETLARIDEQVERYRDAIGLIYHSILREGKVIYERAAGT